MLLEFKKKLHCILVFFLHILKYIEASDVICGTPTFEVVSSFFSVKARKCSRLKIAAQQMFKGSVWQSRVLSVEDNTTADLDSRTSPTLPVHGKVEDSPRLRPFLYLVPLSALLALPPCR